MFCRASTALWACNWNTWARAHPPHCPPERQKWTSVTSYHPCQGHFGNACAAKGLWIWAVVVWLLILPASPCTCGLFLECQLPVQPVGCSWGCKWQLLLLNWWRGSDRECLKSTCLCRIPGSTTMLVLDVIPALYLGSVSCSSSPLLLGQRCSTFYKRKKNPFKAKKLKAGVVRVLGAGPGRGNKNVLLSCWTGRHFTTVSWIVELCDHCQHSRNSSLCHLLIISLVLTVVKFLLYPTICRLYKGWERLSQSQPCFALADFLPFIFSGYYLDISHFSAMIEIFVRIKPLSLGLDKRFVEGRSAWWHCFVHEQLAMFEKGSSSWTNCSWTRP